MITLTRLNNTKILLNSDLIEHMELGADLVITLSNGSCFVVQEDYEEILRRIVDFKRSLYNSPPEFVSKG